MNSELPKEFDLGLEKIPFELRAYCWEICQKDFENPWNAFQEAVMQIHYGGASSEAEALRLFCAEQIRTRTFFFDDLAPSLLAQKLSQEIQTSFQNNARPISAEGDAEKQTVEILHYYFPDVLSLKNFELALSGKMDNIQTLAEEEALTQSAQEAQDDHMLANAELNQRKMENVQKENIQSIPEDQASLDRLSRLSQKISAASQQLEGISQTQESELNSSTHDQITQIDSHFPSKENSEKPVQLKPEEIDNQPVDNHQTRDTKNQLESLQERPKLKAYLESVSRGDNSGVDLPNRIKEILDRYYSSHTGK